MKQSARRKIRITVCVFEVVILTALLHTFLFGKLFVYSAVQPGFTRLELQHCIICRQDGANAGKLKVLDALFPQVEEFHKLRFKRKPVLYVFADDRSYLSRNITRARFFAYPNGSLVISPWALREAGEGKISLNIYVRHELSHILLYQYMGPLNAYHYYPKWLL
ncbi:MAG: hypothetical protein PHT33_12385 [bacterium]|nr:hypothetical protein [bacterium]